MPKTTRPRWSAKTDSVEVFFRPERSLAARAAGLVWRWRVEIVVVIAAVIGWQRLTAAVPTWAAVVMVVSVPGTLLGFAPTRRLILGHAWCVITRHRLRTCLVQIRTMNHAGRLPVFLWVRPTKVGERIRLLMRPGICIKDLEERTEHLAAACWAQEVRMRRSRRLAALVTVDVVRRNPLVPAVPSPLVGLASKVKRPVKPQGRGV